LKNESIQIGEDAKIIKGCKRYKKKYQLLLYDKYAPTLMGICIRYSSSREEAEDMLQEGLLNIYANIKTYKGTGSFEGWLKRIVINTAITKLKKKKKNKLFTQINEEIDANPEPEQKEEVTSKDIRSTIYDAALEKKEILAVINDLPEGLRIVFNLYTFEGYKHKEIAQTLNITENTSKSKLLRARKKIQKNLYTLIQKNEPSHDKIF
jgi:RNA polymerase sigma-70 factor (ECF subfamily)